MKITCPQCGIKFGLEDYIQDQNVRAVLALPQEFGAHWKIALEYCELWNLGSPRKWGKLYRLLGEVLGVMRAEGFKFQRVHYPISAAGVAEALRLVCNQNLKGPITSHGYLRKVMMSISEQEGKERRKEDDRSLRKIESRMRAGSETQGRSGEMSRFSLGDISGKVGHLLQKIEGPETGVHSGPQPIAENDGAGP